MRFGFLLAVLFLLPVQSAVAEISWYIGAGGAITQLRSVDFSSVSGVNAGLPQGGTSTSDEFKDDPLGWQVFGGVMFNENFGIVVKYNDSGDGKSQMSSQTSFDPDGDPTTPPIVTNFTFDSVMTMNGYSIYALQTIPFAKRFEFTVEGGLTRQELDWRWTSTSLSGSVIEDDLSFAVGMLLRYKFVKHFALSGEIEYLGVDFGDLTEKPLKFGANLEFHF